MPHTPGPWELVLNKHGNWPVAICTNAEGYDPIRSTIVRWRGDDHDQLAKMFMGEASLCTHKEAQANARVMTAAPDLLEAAKTVLADLNARIDDAVEAGVPVPVFAGIAALHDAIAKAEGDES